tara:strand:+ start:1337 stop:1924 length:588 start_codon:yes stop_codon:yes gene_type:complete
LRAEIAASILPLELSSSSGSSSQSSSSSSAPASSSFFSFFSTSTSFLRAVSAALICFSDFLIDSFSSLTISFSLMIFSSTLTLVSPASAESSFLPFLSSSAISFVISFALVLFLSILSSYFATFFFKILTSSLTLSRTSTFFFVSSILAFGLFSRDLSVILFMAQVFFLIFGTPYFLTSLLILSIDYSHSKISNS